MEYKIGKRIAKWLALALKQGADQAMPFSVASVLTIDGKKYAGTTDGHRLHVVEVSEALPVGPYTVNVENGILTPATMAYGAAVDWAAVVPHKSDLTHIGLQVDLADHVNVAGNVCYQLLIDGGANVKCSFMDDAIKDSYSYTVRCNCAAYGPIKIDFSQETVNRFAILIPIRADRVKGAVKV